MSLSLGSPPVLTVEENYISVCGTVSWGNMVIRERYTCVGSVVKNMD